MSNIQPYPAYILRVWCLLIVFTGFSKSGFSQNNFDEVSVSLAVPRIGNWELTALIKGQEAYLPVKDFFDILQIKSTASVTSDTVSGFFINPQNKFFIDKLNNQIVFQEKNFELKTDDIIKFEDGLFINSSVYGKIFGLDCIFNFRSLSIIVNTKIELPAVRELQIQQMRKNIIHFRGEKKADTTIKRKFSLFHLGMLDWSVINLSQPSRNSTKITTNIGAVVAGGEANAYLSYSSGEKLDFSKQFYRWRYVNNDFAPLRQITAGNIFVQSIASIYGATSGIQISNTPTTYRRSFGSYRISNTTDPGWTVELYVNDVLVNYTKADASGFYTFDVPLVYGNTIVKLRFYGPWGEERIKEESINIPFNFLPVKQFEYTLSAGTIADENSSKFSRLNLNYGLGNRISIGGGMESLSSVADGRIMPFINTSLRIGSNLLISAEHAVGVRSKAIINYNLPSSLQIEFNYIKYVPGQTAIRSGKSIINNYIEDKKISFFMPLRRKNFSGFSRLSISQLTVPTLKYTFVELLLSGIYKGINTNLTTSASYSDPKHPLIYSNLGMTFRLSKGIRFTPQVQYEYVQNKVTVIKSELEKNLWNKGFLLFGFEKNLAFNYSNYSVGVKYNFSFSQTSFSVLKSNNAVIAIQSARGSLIYNDKTNKIKLSDQSNVGRGGLLILPFLDINGNGKKDKDEPKAYGLKVKINGGKVYHDKKDTTISITGLEAYTNYFVEFDKNSFDNIGWQLKKSTMNIIIEPNNFRLVEVPVAVVADISGTVFSESGAGVKGIGRIIINFYKDSVLMGRTISESDGYFSFVGLNPGAYNIEIDKTQLTKLNFISIPSKIPIIVKAVPTGDIIEGKNFLLQAKFKSNE